MASGLPEPMRMFAEMVERHMDRILGYWKGGLTTAFLKGLGIRLMFLESRLMGCFSIQEESTTAVATCMMRSELRVCKKILPVLSGAPPVAWQNSSTHLIDSVFAGNFPGHLARRCLRPIASKVATTTEQTENTERDNLRGPDLAIRS